MDASLVFTLSGAYCIIATFIFSQSFTIKYKAAPWTSDKQNIFLAIGLIYFCLAKTHPEYLWLGLLCGLERSIYAAKRFAYIFESGGELGNIFKQSTVAGLCFATEGPINLAMGLYSIWVYLSQ